MKVIEGLLHETINSIIIKGDRYFKQIALLRRKKNPLINIRAEHLLLVYTVLIRNAPGGKRPFFCAAV